MPKLRIHELAKELNRTNKEVMDFLKQKKVDVKSHMSTLEEDQEVLVRKSLGIKSSKSGNVEEKLVEKPKKKSNIIQVLRPQNATSQEARKKLQQRAQSEKAARAQAEKREKAARDKGEQSAANPVQEARPQADGASVQGKSAARLQPENVQQAEKNQNIQTQKQQAEKAQVQKPQQSENVQVEKLQQTEVPTVQKSQTEAVQKEKVQKTKTEPSVTAQDTGARIQNTVSQNAHNSRPQSDRNNNRSQGDRNGNRPQRDRNGNRPQGDRNSNRSQGDRNNNRSYGDRNNNRPQGDRNNNRSYGDRNSNRPQGDRNNNRPYGERNGNRPQGDRNSNRSYGDRPARPQGDRPQRPFGDRTNRPGDRNGRPQGNGFGRDKKPQAETIDLGLKKPSRDTSHKDKDKTKDSLRDKKFGEDRRPNQGNRPNQSRRPNQNLPKALQKPSPKPKEEKKEEVKEITLPEKLTIRELAEKMKMQPSVIVKKLFLEGIMVTVNHEIDFEKAQEIALDYDIIAEAEEKVDVIEELLREEEEDEKDMASRPPVVCVMGHVDHGKTSLLDAIRDTHVTDREAGGITQHIGATVVTINEQNITFLDTPGHEAFTAMRMRGANSTDIAVLVVAADDGVMPQTVEAINHAKAAGVEIIVAINKIDKPSANVERVKQELSEYELIPEDWGGSTIFVPVSAHTREGITELLEMILLTAEVMELKANPKRKARGLVIEAKLDKGKGPVANILIQKGTLHVGDYIAAGACSGKVRAMMDDKGRRVKEAGPSMPVELLGLNDVPNAGEILVATDTDKDAKNFAATFVSEGKNKLLEETKAKMSLDDLFSQIQEGNLKELNIVVKADVQGSVEAVKQSLVRLSNEEVVVKIVHGGVGAINESDVTLAAASNAIIIGFNVRPDVQAKTVAEQEGVDVRLYRVIYQAIEDVEAAMKGMLDPIFEEKVIGHAEIRQLFKASGVGTIAGSYILDGIFQRGCKVRISREGTQIFEGPLASLKRFKDDVKEVKSGYECGLVFDGFNDIQEFDIVEAYVMVEVPR